MLTTSVFRHLVNINSINGDTSLCDYEYIISECFINPSPGRCAPSQRRRFYSYSSKTRRCEEIMGCYSVRDRNVFLSRGGCSRVCAVDPNVTIIPLPDGPGMSVAVGMYRNAVKSRSVFTNHSQECP